MWTIPVSITETRTTPNDNHQSTIDTLRVMQSLARDAATSPAITRVVDSLIDKLRSNNPSKLELARLIYYWVKDRVRFKEDEQTALEIGYSHQWMRHRFGIDLLIHPVALLSMRSPMGDCDDFSMLIAALLVAANIPCVFEVIAANEREPLDWSHVYVLANVNGGWLPMDASHGTVLGWETRTRFREMEWSI